MRPKPTATNKDAAEQDHALTYADLVDTDGKCSNCGLADLPKDTYNRRQHWASCCYYKLTNEDQHVPTLRQAHTGRTGRNAELRAGGSRIQRDQGLPRDAE